MDRRTFVKAAISSPLAVSAASVNNILLDKEVSEAQEQSGLNIRFLGTGVADWNGKDERGEMRRLSSILIEKHILIDLTPIAVDMIPGDAHPDTIFYTHSHGDHFNSMTALRAGIKQVFLSQTWYDMAVKIFQNAATELNCPMPEITPLHIGQKIKLSNLTITPVPANHATENIFEQALLYLIEKDGARVLYATDTGGLPAVATRLIGIDAHNPNGRPLTGLIMEATMGMGQDTDFRLFTHTSVDGVMRTVKVLENTKRYTPPPGQPVFLTHLARTLHGTQAELDAQLPAPLKAAYDGLEVVFKPL